MRLISLASFPGSPRARTKNRKERGEPGKIYHVRNVIGRENLITCGWTNELAHAVWTEYSCDSFMADRMGLDGTMLHYLAVRKAMVSLHRPVHSKITLTYSLTWQTDRCTPRRNYGFQGAIKCQGGPFLGFAQVFSALIVRKKLPERTPTSLVPRLWVRGCTCTVDYRPTTCVGTSAIRLCSIKSSLPFSLPLRHSRDELFQALYRFSVLQATESWAGPGNEAIISRHSGNSG